MHIFTSRIALALMGTLSAAAVQGRTFDYTETFDSDASFTQSTDLPDGWGSNSPAEPLKRYTGSWLGTGAHSGDYVLGTMPTTAAGRDAWAFTKTMELKGGVTYTVSFWVCMPGGTAPVFNNAVTLWAGTGQTAAECTVKLGTTGETKLAQWTQQSYEFTPETDGTYCFGLNVTTSLFQAGSVAIDDFSVTGEEPDPSTDLPEPPEGAVVAELPYSQSFDNENGDYDGTSYVPGGWLSTGDAPFRTAAISGVHAKDGDYYVVAPESRIARNDRLYTCFFPLIAGTTYDASFYLYMPGNEDARSDFRFTVGEEQDADLHTAIVSMDGVHTDGWQLVKATFTPDHSGYYCFSFALTGETAVAGEAAIDLFRLTAKGLVAKPQADFGWNGTYSQMNSHLTLLSGQQLQLIDRSSSAATWQWECPGAVIDGADTQAPTIAFPASGTYDVTLTVTNERGESTSTRSVAVDIIDRASSMPLTVYDPSGEQLQGRGSIPYFPTAEEADYATGPNHFYHTFAQRFALPSDCGSQVNALTLYLCNYSLSNAIEGAERKKKLTIALYSDHHGKPGTLQSSTTMTLEEAFGTTGLSKAEMRTVTLPEPLKGAGTFWLAFEFDPTVTLDVADANLARTIVGLGGFWHRSGQTSLYARPDSVPEDCTFVADGQAWCPVDTLSADMAGMGLNVTAWIDLEGGAVDGIALAPDGSRPFAARFSGSRLLVSGTKAGQRVSVTDMAGRTVLAATAQGATLSIDASALPHGTYLVDGVKVAY